MRSGSSVFLEAACACALVHRSAPGARKWLERANRLRKPESSHSAEAAIAVCERRYGDAIRLYGSAYHRLVRDRLDSGVARFEMQKLTEYQRTWVEALGRPGLVLTRR